MYGFLISVTSIICLLLIEKIIKKGKLVNIKDFWNLTIFLIPSAIIGGRIYHVLDYWGYYSKEPLEILNFRNGGLGIYGALIAAVIVVYTFSKVKKQNSLIYLDLLILFTPLVQIAGRIGNYFNKELFGLPTKAPWGINIPIELRPSEFVDYSKFHPLFFYEIILLAVLFSYLIDMYINKKIEFGKGKILGVYFVGYGVIRTILEPIRIGDSWILLNLNLTYLFSIVMIVIGLTIIFKNNHKFNKKII